MTMKSMLTDDLAELVQQRDDIIHANNAELTRLYQRIAELEEALETVMACCMTEYDHRMLLRGEGKAGQAFKILADTQWTRVKLKGRDD